MPFNKYVKVPGSERQPMKGATPSGTLDTDETMQVTVVLRSRSGAHEKSLSDLIAAGQRISREEYAARYETLEEAHSTEPLPRPVGGRPRRRPHWVTGVVIGALVLAGLAAALVLHDRGGSNAVPGGPAGPTVPLTGEGTTTVSTQTTTAAKPPSTNPKPKTIDVKLVAVTGRCWLLVRKGSALGPLVYEGTLEPGQSVSLHGIRYWARLGAPTALALSVNGAAQSLPTRTGNVVIDARGVTPTS